MTTRGTNVSYGLTLAYLLVVGLPGITESKGNRLEKAEFDRVTIHQADGTFQTLTREEYYRIPLRVRVDQLCKGQARFFCQGQPVSALKAMRQAS